MGGSYLKKNLESLGMDGTHGRLFILGFQGGATAEIDLRSVFTGRLTIQAAGLRSRSAENKARIAAEVEKLGWPAIEAKKVKPIVHCSFPLAEAAVARRLMADMI